MSVKVNKSVTLHQGRVFNILLDNITLPNNVTTDLEVIRHPGASAIIAVFPDKTTILIQQYRHAVGKHIWEIPAGVINQGETPLQCAQRELTEETGYSAKVWHKLGEIMPTPGYSDEHIHIFIAEELNPAQQHLDADEMLEIHKFKFDDIMDMVAKGIIQDSKTISSLYLFWLKNR